MTVSRALFFSFIVNNQAPGHCDYDDEQDMVPNFTELPFCDFVFQHLAHSLRTVFGANKDNRITCRYSVSKFDC